MTYIVHFEFCAFYVILVMFIVLIQVIECDVQMMGAMAMSMEEVARLKATVMGSARSVSTDLVTES